MITGRTGASAIVIESALVADPAEFSAFTVKLEVPAAVGVPVIVPLVFRVNPAGSVPLEMLHVMGVVPVAARVWLYAVPTVPFGSVVVVIAGSATTVIESAFVTDPAEFSAFTVKLAVPAVVGVPVIVPFVFRVSPAGSVPLETLHVMGVVPVAASVWL